MIILLKVWQTIKKFKYNLLSITTSLCSPRISSCFLGYYIAIEIPSSKTFSTWIERTELGAVQTSNTCWKWLQTLVMYMDISVDGVTNDFGTCSSHLNSVVAHSTWRCINAEMSTDHRSKCSCHLFTSFCICEHVAGAYVVLRDMPCYWRFNHGHAWNWLFYQAAWFNSWCLLTDCVDI